MDSLREYILSVVCAAILCGIIKGLAGKTGGSTPVMKLLCGIFLTLSMVKPLMEIKLEDLTDYTRDLHTEAVAASAQGEEIYDSLLKDRIIASTESYILDKARELSMELDVEVSLDQDQIPREVILKGEWEEPRKRELQDILASELGIAKERQIWIG